MRDYRIGPGASSLVLIVLVLALATLGALSVMSAKSEMGLSQRTLEMHESYYAASARAQDMIAEIDGLIIEASGTESDSVFSALEEILPEWASIEDRTVTFSTDAGAGRRLVVRMEILPEGGARYKITLHSLESVAE